MHIEVGVVDAAKMSLSYVTATAVAGIAIKEAIKNIRKKSINSFILKSLITSLSVLIFFEILPHKPIGVSEVHFIFASSLFLLFGAAPTAFGLVGGLFIQSIFFSPQDIPQFGINVTTLLAPLFAMSALSKKFIPKDLAFKDIRYRDALKLSIIYQGGIVSWVAFWAFYGQGFGKENIASVLSFGSAYMSVIIFEPFVDLGVLAVVKKINAFKKLSIFDYRLFGEAEN